MSFKIVIIGGGSYAWTPTLAGDLFLRKSMDGSHLSLVDTNPEAAQNLKGYCEKQMEQAGVKWTVTVDDLETALKDANVVCISISTGGLLAMEQDYSIPEKYGIYHTVGDTVGPGGISRTLRNVPIFVDIAKKMEQICPNAWMVHVTNPLSQLTRAVSKTTSIKVVGLCHNFSGTMSMLAQYFKAKYDDIDSISVGVNHYTFMKNITCKGRNIESELSLDGYKEYYKRKNGILITNTTDDVINEYLIGNKGKNMEYYLNFHLFEKWGVLPVGSSNHVAENLPFYCNDDELLKKYYIRRKGVLPRRQDLADAKKLEVEQVLRGEAEIPQMKLSREGLSSICEAMYTGIAERTMVTMPNQGQISNVPLGVAVETWGVASGNGVHPVISGEVPEVVSGSLLTIINEQELSVEAALTGRRDLVYQAMYVSPLVANKDIAEKLADELMEANKEYLPQFYN